MSKDKEIIQTLLDIIDSYDNNDIAKSIIISCYPENDLNIVILLTTKGEANKNTPFYFGNMYTCIIKEYWENNDLIWADMLYQTRRKSI